MVLPCPNCGAGVGEESCAGCRTSVPYYHCGSCGKTFANPRFRSDVQCSKCGGWIYEEPHKSVRHNIKLYICQNCGHVEENPKFTNFHGCAGCQPPRCKDCDGLLATNSLIDYYVCSGCGNQSPK